MAGDHDTPIGTPILIAPGKVFLVGEYAVLDEGSAVVAAVPLYAQAQFVPRLETMPPLVSEVVRRARAHLGDVTAALPPGTVLVTTSDFQLDCPSGGLGSSAAISVAAAASVYESLGLDLDERKAEILAIADASRRAAQGEVGSGADTVAATYGGLVEVARSAGAPPVLRNLTVPSGLSLVLFSAGPSISTKQMTAGLTAYAEREKAAFAEAKARLQKLAQDFVERLAADEANHAVQAAGAYGEELAELARAAEVPIVSEAFAQAGKLARQYGGIAKPAAAGSGEIGIALFAAPDAASAFRRACVAPVVPFAAGIDMSGARCRLSSADQSADVAERVTSKHDDDGFEEDAETVIQTFDAAIMAMATPVKDTVSASPIEIHTTSASSSLPSVQPGPSLLRRVALPAAALLAACVAAAWLGFSKQVRRREPRASSVPVHMTAPALSIVHAPPSMPAPDLREAAPQTVAAKPAPEPPLPVSEPSPAPAADAKPSIEKSRSLVHTARVERHQQAPTINHTTNRTQESPRPTTKASLATPSRRAGALSPSDF